ncbi:MAG: phage terminase large subunit, partial [Opitutaceae bacterium]|nr:phage terminase large subunit [Opitutaceae bacterium]
MSNNISQPPDSTIANTTVAIALLRSNLASFIHMSFKTLNPDTVFVDNWHIHAIAWHLEQVRTGKIRRLIITMPPRSLKSISASTAFPAFVHGNNPSKHIISVSYGQDLSVKFQNDYRAIISSPWFRSIFPECRIDPRKDTEREVVLTARGSRLATSIDGSLTGRGADIIIIDDPLKPSDAMSEIKRDRVNEWSGSILLSRLNDKKDGAIVIVTQRLHAHDLVGHVLEQAPDDWVVLNLPAIATDEQRIQIANNRFYVRSPGGILHPEHEPERVLDQLRRDLGSDAFEAQYQQNPVPPGGAMFKRDWNMRYDTPPYEADHEIIQSWDTASKTGPANDWSVCTTWMISQGKHYLIDVCRMKLDYPQLKAQAIRLYREYNPRMVLIEDTGVGTGLIEEPKEAGINTVAITPVSSKEARASVQSAKLEGGRVLFPHQAPWLSELETELCSFPGSRHDDQVDSIV